MYRAEKNGKTLHLLKSKSKPTAFAKKRKKIPILGSYTEYKDSKQKALLEHQKFGGLVPQNAAKIGGQKQLYHCSP